MDIDQRWQTELRPNIGEHAGMRQKGDTSGAQGGTKRCRHGRLAQAYSIRSACEHGKIGWRCLQCRPFPHGKLKGNCSRCLGCPQGRVEFKSASCKARAHRYCKCNGCPRGKVTYECMACNGCQNGRRRGRCAKCRSRKHLDNPQWPERERWRARRTRGPVVACPGLEAKTGIVPGGRGGR